MGDRRRYSQILINLIKNATKFTPEGHIEVILGYNEGRGLLTGFVRDTGVGIKKEDISSLFKKFGKLKRTAEMNS